MGAWFDARWADAVAHADAIFDPDRHDDGLVAELFEDDVGVWPESYFWQLSSAVIKDAWALYEVFLEELAHDVLARFGAGLALMDTDDSWKGNESQAFYNTYVGIEVFPAPIDSIRWMRNKMAHLRSTLRSPGGMAEFTNHLSGLHIDQPMTSEEQALGLVDHRPYFSRGVELTQLQTLRILDILADHIAQVALAAFQFEYGGHSNVFFDAVQHKSPLKVKDLPAKKLLRLG